MSRYIFTITKNTPYNYNMNKGYGQIISRLRIERGLTQKELAEKMGISASLITDYERGKLRLHDEIIAKLAHAMQISADVILGIEAQNQSADPTNSLRIMKRVKKIEKLPKFKQKIVLQMIDGYTKGVS
jgi:transcriptional regulator with XRE-family HTH domain